MNYRECVWKAYNELVSVMYKENGWNPSRKELEEAIETAIGFLGQALD